MINLKKINIKKLAIRIPNWIGDAVLSTPLVRFTRKYFPGAEIYLILRKEVSPVFQYNNSHDHLVIINDKQDGIIKTGNLLKKYKFDLYFNLPESFSSIMIAFLSRARIRAGYKGETAGLFLNIPLKPPEKIVNRAVKYFRILSSFLTKYKELDSVKMEKEFLKTARTEIFLQKEEIKRAKEILKQHKLKKRIIGINPNASALSRQWLDNRYAWLAENLIKKHKACIILFGSEKEQPYVGSITQMTEVNLINLAGKITLREYMALLKSIDLFITNDSGPMHLANAVGTDVITLEGAADVNETGMFNPEGKRIYIDKKLPCSPCVKNICPGNNECMRAITVDDVLKEVKKNL